MANVPSATANVGLTELSDDLQEARNNATLGHRKAEDLAGLAKNDRERHAIEKADENRPRQEVCERAKPEEACRHAEKSGEESERYG
jgi:hypothetical protein